MGNCLSAINGMGGGGGSRNGDNKPHEIEQQLEQVRFSSYDVSFSYLAL